MKAIISFTIMLFVLIGLNASSIAESPNTQTPPQTNPNAKTPSVAPAVPSSPNNTINMNTQSPNSPTKQNPPAGQTPVTVTPQTPATQAPVTSTPIKTSNSWAAITLIIIVGALIFFYNYSPNSKQR